MMNAFFDYIGQVQRGEQSGSRPRHPPTDEETDAQDYEVEDAVGAFPQWCNAVTTQVGNPEKSLTREEPKDMSPKKKGDVPGKGLMYVDIKVNGKAIRAMVDTGATHNYIYSTEVERLGLTLEKGCGWVKAINSAAQPVAGIARSVLIKIGIVKKRGEMAYKVDPPHWWSRQLHPFFHVSMLKPFYEDTADPSRGQIKRQGLKPKASRKRVTEAILNDRTHDLQMIVHEIISEGIKVDEQMQVAAIIDKLPKSWKEFQKGLRHKQLELSIVNLMARLQIEEEARKQDKKNEALANNTHANHANSHQGNGNAYGNGAKISFLINSKIVGVKKPKP
ncbi:hypothetical protein RJ639_025930 [Escallonia herrerae]|uniref:Uncharacterized protein n=1 Tax=Escallonia herrerae TaxID=1293975 RepID=A0AA88UXG6_9ASTE|nr:hypothetical protein RJ639_025930 [Escallonia herrerae]